MVFEIVNTILLFSLMINIKIISFIFVSNCCKYSNISVLSVFVSGLLLFTDFVYYC